MADIQYEVQPVTVEDVPPPPSYEDVMGQFATSVKHGQSTLPRLAYIDIMPRLLHPGNIKEKMEPTFQKFNDLVIGANVWLKDNPGLSVWKCETVERKVNSGKAPGTVSIDLENMIQHEATFGFNCFVFGLRLWLTPKVDGQRGVQELGIINVLPVKKEVDVTVHYRTGRRNMMFGVAGISQHQKMITYEGFKKSLKDFNEKVQKDPIPGTILNIESTTLKFGEGRQQIAIEDAVSEAMWYVLDGQSSKRYTQFMRVFYVCGSPTKPEICVKEFLPKQLGRPSNSFQNVRFGTFDTVVEQATTWVQQQAGIQISNIETGEADMKRFFNNIDIDTDSTDQIEYGLMTAPKLRFIRIFYSSNPSMPTYAHTFLSSRLFVPISIGGNKYETMTQTMSRIDSWMLMTGLPIFGVETASFLRENLPSASRGERCDFELKPFSAKYWINGVRVYFSTLFVEPNPNPFPVSTQASNSGSSSCNII